MMTLIYLLKKEFRQIFRNKAVLPMILVMPLIQLIILPLAADFEVKNINISIIDRDHSSLSRRLTDKISASGYFVLTSMERDYKSALKLIENDKIDLVLEIPSGFERNLYREDQQQLMLGVNAINGIKAGLGGSYMARIMQSFNKEIRGEWQGSAASGEIKPLEINYRQWFNPHMNYKYFVVPGILGALITMLGGFLASLNIVREKEIGTIEQINVTPISKTIFILGKLIPFWILGLFVFSVGFGVIMIGVYGIMPVGSLIVIYSFVALYMVAVLGLGLLISTYCETQQQAMSLGFFCIMIFMLMSGLWTPVRSMPDWAQWISNCSPLTWFIEAIRSVVLKGSGFSDIQLHFLVIFGMGVFLNGWAVLNYRKTS